jgi:adenylate cyclase
VSAYLDLASDAVAAERGTVDKFIGDAVMAFWGAPRADPNQALNACRSALAISASINRVVLPAGIEGELSVRIGLQSGPAVVGNLGSATRLNYTALGDTVNLASRLEAVNKVYGTTILIGPATRAAAGEAIVVREVDTVAVYGRAEGVRVFELLALADGSPRPDWIVIYEVALGEYRAGRFVAALKHLEHVAAARPADGPTRRLAELCRRLSTDPPLPGWEPVTVLDMK